MKRITHLILLLTMALLSPPAHAADTPPAASTDARPKLEVPQAVFDAGTMYRSKEKLEHVFVIQNSGTADLKILSARPGCGCTVTKFDELVKPGSEGKVAASVDVSHFSGPIEKSVDVETNDPSQPHIKLSIKANIKTYFDVRPMEQIRFTVSRGSSDTKELTITPTYEKPLRLLAPRIKNTDAFDVKFDPPAGDSKSYKLTVSLKNTAKIGNQSDTITIPVEGDIVPPQEIQVFAVVRGPIAANPALISFQVKTFPDEVAAAGTANIYQQPDETTPLVGKSDPGQPLRVIARKDQWYQIITGANPQTAAAKVPAAATRVGWVKSGEVKATRQAVPPEAQTFSIQKNNGKFKILEYTSTLPDVTLKMETPDPEASVFTLKASLAHPEQARKNAPPGSIIVKTNDPDQPEVRVPVYVIVS